MRSQETLEISTTDQPYESTYQAFTNAGDYLYGKHLDITNPVNLLDEALNEYSKAMESGSDSSALLAKVSRSLLRQGNYGKAEQMARRALGKNARLKDSYYVLGYIRYKQQEYKESIKLLNQAISCSGFSTSRFRFCLFYSYLEAAKRSKNIFSALSQYGLAAYQFVIAMLISRFEAEPVQFFQLMFIFPGILRGYLREQACDKDGALAEYLKLHEKFPGLPPVMNLIANLYYRKGMHPEAIEWLQKSVNRDPLNEEGYYQLATLLEEQGEYEAAIGIYRRLLSLRPNDPQVHCSLGNTYSMMNAYDEAASHYKAALQLGEDPKWRALIAQTLASMYQDIQRDPEAAQMAFQVAINLNPDEVDNYIHLGILHFEKADYGNSQLVYEKALAIDPENPRVHSNLGYLKWLGGAIPEAVEHYEKAISIDPAYEIPHNNLGVIHLDVLGNISLAIELLERATTLNENYALAYYNLGRAYIFLDRKLDAAQCFQRAQILNEYTKELDNEELVARLNNIFNTYEG